MSKISEQKNTLELYYSFKDDFFTLLDNNVSAWEECDIIKQHYINYDFNKIRVIIEHKVSIWQQAVLEDILKDKKGSNISNEAYRSWKQLDNIFSEFQDKHEELFELNII